MSRQHRKSGAGDARPLSRRRLPRLPSFGLFLGAAVAAGFALSPQIADWAAGHLRSRLETRTGLAWRIGGAHLRLTPGLAILLDDVEIGEPASGGLSAKIAGATISGDLASLIGGEGEWRADLSRVSLRVPITEGNERDAQDASKAASGAGIAAIHALAKGAEMTFDASHMAVLRAPEAGLSFRVAPAEKQRVDIELAGKNYELTFGFETDARATLASGAPATFAVAAPGSHEVWAKGDCIFAANSKRLAFRAMSAIIASAPFSGSATINLLRQPEADLDLHFPRLALGGLGPKQDGKANVAVFPDLDPAAFVDFPVTATVKIDELRLGALRAGEVKARLYGDGRGVDVAFDAKSFYDGALRGHYTVAPEERRLHQLSLSANVGRLSSLLAAVAGTGALDGQAVAHLEAQANGTQLGDLVSTARGTADVAISHGKISTAAISGIANTPLISDIISDDKGLLTSFREFSGRFAIDGGKAASKDLRFESPLVSAPGSGVADLEKGRVDFSFVPALHAGGKANGGLKFPIRVHGAWTDPEVTANLDSVFDNPLSAIQSLEDIGSALFGDDRSSSKADKDGDLGRKRHRN